MITLKCRSYTKKELDMLEDVLNNGLAMLQSVDCDGKCPLCEYRHVCIDIQSAIIYAQDKQTELAHTYPFNK